MRWCRGRSLAAFGLVLWPLMPLSAVAQDAGAAQRSLQEQRLRGQLRQQRLEFKPDSELQPIPIQPDGAANQDPVSPRDGNVLIGQLEIVGAGFLSVQNRAWLDSKYLNKPGTETILSDLQLDVELLLKKSNLLGHVYSPVINQAGSVAVEVIVARLDAVRVVENTTKLSSQWAVNTILDSVRLQSEIRIDKITSGLLKLNDLAGIRAVALFEPGSTPGGTDVLLRLSPSKQRDFNADFNNYTIEDTGPYQFQAEYSFKNFFGRGENLDIGGQLSGDGNSVGTYLGYANVVWPLSPGGLQALVSYNWTNYRQLGDNYDFNSQGEFQSVSGGFRQVLLRRTDRSINAQLIGEFDQSSESELGYQFSDYTSALARFSLDGSYQRNLFGGVSITSGLLTLSGGNLSSNGPIASPFYAQVNVNPGWWGKVFALIDHYYTFSNTKFSLETLAQGQGAFNNLDAYEAISLGWPNAVRAYSPGSNVGDSGLTLQNTLRYQAFPRLSLRAYVDAGYVWSFSNAFPGNSVPNYGLWGPGIGLDFGTRGDLLISVDLAFQGSSVPGEGSGGSSYPAQLWLSVKKWL